MTEYRKPGKKAFWDDMNKHSRAEYRHVGERHILELDSLPAGNWRLLVWEAVRQGGEYVRPGGSNSFEWDAIGSENYPSRDEAADVLEKITGVHGVRTWSKCHPYDGPRTRWAEANRDEGDA